MESSRVYVPDDLGSPANLADPYPVYRALREASPVRFQRVPAGVVPGIDQPIHAWALLRHADVMAALLGIPAEQAATFRHWSEATIGYVGLPPEERRSYPPRAQRFGGSSRWRARIRGGRSGSSRWRARVRGGAAVRADGAHVSAAAQTYPPRRSRICGVRVASHSYNAARVGQDAGRGWAELRPEPPSSAPQPVEIEPEHRFGGASSRRRAGHRRFLRSRWRSMNKRPAASSFRKPYVAVGRSARYDHASGRRKASSGARECHRRGREEPRAAVVPSYRAPPPTRCPPAR
jgi:hypothetical protein